MFPRIDYQISLGCIFQDCDKTFGNTKQIFAHLREEHEVPLGIKEYQCPYCDKIPKYGAGLIHHIRTHTGEKPYFCPVNGCAFRSATKNNLRVHLSGKMHGNDVLMNFAHIFDRPRKRRRITDLPDIVVKKHKQNNFMNFPAFNAYHAASQYSGLPIHSNVPPSIAKNNPDNTASPQPIRMPHPGMLSGMPMPSQFHPMNFALSNHLPPVTTGMAIGMNSPTKLELQSLPELIVKMEEKTAILSESQPLPTEPELSISTV